MTGVLESGDPRRVGPYRIVARLGSGGMGRVYLGRSPGGRAVAVKVIRPDLAADPQFRIRFAREAEAAGAVSGAFTAAVVDADPHGEPPWLATVHVPGVSLTDAVARYGVLPEPSLLALGAGLAEAVQAIHAAGLVHRDLKPSNVLLASDGPKVIDFGIAVAAESSALTRSGVVLGTPGYMAPEQVTGRRAGPLSDVFALGAVLAFAATGQGPFGRGSLHALGYRVVHEEPGLDAVPPGLRPLVARCLAKDPAGRPAVSALLDDLAGRLLAQPTGGSAGGGGDTVTLALKGSRWLPAPIARAVDRAGTTGEGMDRMSEGAHRTGEGAHRTGASPDRTGEGAVGGGDAVVGEGDPAAKGPDRALGFGMRAASVGGSERTEVLSRRSGPVPVDHPSPTDGVPGWPDRITPERAAPEHEGPERELPEREVPEREVPEPEAPEREAPEHDGPEDGPRPGSGPGRAVPVPADSARAADGEAGAGALPVPDAAPRTPGRNEGGPARRRVLIALAGAGAATALGAGGLLMFRDDDPADSPASRGRRKSRRRWEFATGGPVTGALTATDGTVYAGSKDRSLYALDAETGEQRWQFTAGNGVYSGPVVAGGVVYVGSADYNLYALDTATGAKRWEFPTGDEVNSSPTVAGGVVYVGSDDRHLYAVDARTHERRWAFRADGWFRSSPVVAWGAVYAGSRDGSLYAVEARTGAQRWRFPTGGEVKSSPAIADRIVYAGSYDGTLYAVDCDTGERRWAFATGGGVGSSPAVSGGVVYVGSDDGKVYALDARSGSPRWKSTVGNVVYSSPVVAGGTVYVGAKDGSLHALDAETGARRWRYATGADVKSSPAVAGSAVYVGNDAGTVFAVRR
ncbi:PQQ-binding-like beta-propeller repeat protein [Streptomyces sp. NPDC048639]|uniref:outer membrane protein assembly factor BamB family protein n=1 Tax=Streptomyces sp. NPDC048639 TaxID=3365581 RepID=UPI0037177887